MAEFFVCPLCGRQRPVSGWDPVAFRDDITLRDGVGKGWGGGFEYSNERTADIDHGDLDIVAMARRCLEIVRICVNTGEVSYDDLVDHVPDEFTEEIVKEKAEEYGYTEDSA